LTPGSVFVRLSPSRVEKALECFARWGFAELPGGIAEPPTEATSFGTETHAAHERRFKHGIPYDLDSRPGWVAAAMAPYLPNVIPWQGGAELELTYEVEGVTLRGTLDLCWPDFDRRIAVVRDYKTTGADWRWAKLEREALFGHTQAPLYTLMMMNRHGFERAFAGWLYAKRPPLGPAPWPAVEVRPSDHCITRDEATERVHLRMLPIAKQMQAYADAGMTAADAHKLPKNLRSCRKYNRLCPYISKCQPEKDPYSMNPFLQSIANAAGAAAPATPATNPTPPATETPPAQGNMFGSAPAGNTAPTDTPTANAGSNVNPPEGGTDGDAAGKRKTGKGKKEGTSVVLDDASLEALAERVVDKLALRLTRNIA
jgi:hypothetical protein